MSNFTKHAMSFCGTSYPSQAFGPVLFLLGGYMMYFYRRFIPLVGEQTDIICDIFPILNKETLDVLSR